MHQQPQRLGQLVAHLTDKDLKNLRRGGHDYRKVYAAYHAAVRMKGAPTAILAQTVKGWTLGPSVQARNVKELIAWLKANPSRGSTGTTGVGSGIHVCSVLLDGVMGTKITHIPYRGASFAMQDLLGGRIDFIAEQISTALPQIQGGNVKAIVALGLDRAPGLEDLPTAEEQGMKGLDCGSWASFSFPKGTPQPIVQKLAKATNEAIDTPAVRERFQRIGVTVTPPERRGPEFLTKFVPAEIERWARPIKASGVSAE